MEFPTAVLTALAKGIEGQLADARDVVAVSRFVATGTIAPGRFVAWVSGDEDDEVRLPSAEAHVTGNGAQGVTTYTGTSVNNPYAAGDSMSVVRVGRVLVKVTENVTPADDVYVRITADTGKPVGTFGNISDSGKAIKVSGMRFLETVSADGLCVLDVFMPSNIGATGATGPTGPTGPTA